MLSCRDRVAMTANRMIRHLAPSGTREDQIKREAIIAVTNSILEELEGYRGFRYIGQSEQLLKPLEHRVWDNTRIQFI